MRKIDAYSTIKPDFRTNPTGVRYINALRGRNLL